MGQLGETGGFATNVDRVARDQQMNLVEFTNDIDNMAELLVTLDPVTTGFCNDLQLIIQLGIDKSILRLNMFMKGCTDVVTLNFAPQVPLSEQIILAIGRCYQLA
jgi:hypothetical protein